jgi:hypothetical protein
MVGEPKMSLQDFTMPAAKPIPLNRFQLDILTQLSERGATKAYMFDEDDLDGLFKMRPRLIALVPNNEEPVVDITAEGRLRLHQQR